MNPSRLEPLMAVLVAITCCAGLPLVVAAGAGAALWFGGARGAAPHVERERV